MNEIETTQRHEAQEDKGWKTYAVEGWAIFAWLLVLAGMLTACSSTATPVSVPPGSPVIKVTVNTGSPGVVIPPDFLGLSFEAGELAGNRFDKSNAVLIQLVQNLGQGSLRFGGGTLDTRIHWSRTPGTALPRPAIMVTGPDLDRLFGFAKASGWRVLLGLDLGQYDPVAAADEAEYAASVGGGSLLSVEIGSEPNIFQVDLQRPDYSYKTYQLQVEAYLQAIHDRRADVPISGPATCCDNGPDWFSRFITDEGPKLSFATMHYYPLADSPTVTKDSEKYPSITNLLSPALMTRTEGYIGEALQSAESHHLALRIDETNSVAEGGAAGVSNVFASALWAIDYLETLAEMGVSGVNIHTIFVCSGRTYSSICFTNKTYTAQPVYYGMLFFSQAVQGRSVPVEVSPGFNVTSHAALADDKKLRGTLVNKDPSRSVIASIQVSPNSYAKATVMRLLAPSLEAAADIKLGGRAVAGDGNWSPAEMESLVPVENGFQLALPAGSAALVIFE